MKELFKFKNIFLVLILLLALYLRLNNLHQRTLFDADQEWLATRAVDLLKGDLPLLGPVTSVGSFSIGPGFIYLWAISSFIFSLAPISGAYLSIFLGLLFLIAIFFVVKEYIGLKVAYLTLFLCSISSSLIFWDQSPWAPSLFYLSQAILLFATLSSLKYKWGYYLIAFSIVLAFQSHFGIVLSIISVLFFFIFVKPVKIDRKTLLITALILFLGFLPNIVYDLTHDFNNLKKLAYTIDDGGVDYFVSFNKIVNVLNFNTTSVVYPKNNNLFDSVFTKSLFALILVNAISLLRDKKMKNISLLLLITLVLPAAIFYMQQGKFSEYYLLMTVPSSILLFSLFLYRIINNKLLLSLIVLMSIYLNYQQISDRYVSWNLKAKEMVAQKIVEVGGKSGYGISINSKLGDSFGFNYIFNYYGIEADYPPKQGQTKIFSIAVPQGFEGVVGTHSYDGIGLLWSGM